MVEGQLPLCCVKGFEHAEQQLANVGDVVECWVAYTLVAVCSMYPFQDEACARGGQL